MNTSVKKTATEGYSEREREREREREQNLVYMMNWNQKDFNNKICKAQNVRPNGMLTYGVELVEQGAAAHTE